MLTRLINIGSSVKSIVSAIPFELIIFIGSFIEEIFPLLPSPLIVIITKMSTSPNSYSLLYLFFIAIIAAIGKTFGALLLYLLGDKGGDIIIRRFGGLLGVSHNSLEKIGKRFSGSWKDSILLFFLRALPIIPTTPVSLMCGVIKLNLRTFVVSTLIGLFVRIFALFYIGVFALSSPLFLTVFIMMSILVFIYYKKKRE